MGIIPGAVTTEADRINSPFSNSSEMGGFIAVGMLFCVGVAVTSPVWLVLVPFKAGRRLIRCTVGLPKWGYYTGKGDEFTRPGAWVRARETVWKGDDEVHSGPVKSPYPWLT